MNEIGDRFAYRGQVAQRHVMRREKNRRGYFGSWVLEAIAGYGYKPERTFLSYLVVIFGFALAYFGILHHFDFNYALDALVYSLTSFHGRGFFPGGGTITAHDPQVVLAALEAVIGLFIELILIATFSRRFLGG